MYFYLANPSSVSSAESATSIIIAVVLLVVLVALIALFIYWKRQHRGYSDEDVDEEEEATDLNVAKEKTDNI